MSKVINSTFFSLGLWRETHKHNSIVCFWALQHFIAMATSPGFSTCSYKLLSAFHTTKMCPPHHTQSGLKTRMHSFVHRTGELEWGPILCEHLHLVMSASSFFPPYAAKDFWCFLVLCVTWLDGNKAPRGYFGGIFNLVFEQSLKSCLSSSMKDSHWKE